MLIVTGRQARAEHATHASVVAKYLELIELAADERYPDCVFIEVRAEHHSRSIDLSSI